MVGNTVPRSFSLGDILSDKQIHHVVEQSIGGEVPWSLVGCEVKPAMEGLAGFLGDHIRATLRVSVGDADGSTEIRLFMKHLPMTNKPKAEFIDQSNYFRREMFMYKLLEEIAADHADPSPWCSKAYLYTDTNIVMPDLAAAGYAPRDFRETLDLPHALLAAASLARFHAAFTNYETRKSYDNKRPYSTYQEHSKLFNEPTLRDSPWLRTCPKLTVNFLAAFSTKYNSIPDLESKLTKLYLEACDSLKEETDTLNVLVHKDLWVNNILFKYQNGIPTSAILLDFQCIRYGPPAFDVMSFLYLTTSRQFRERHEREILLNYYKIFCENLDFYSKQRMEKLGYNQVEFLKWCENSRMFGVFVAIGYFPYTLMDPQTAQKTFDDPETYERYLKEDRSGPVLAHARRCAVYKNRQLHASEEFLERYVLQIV